MNKLLQTTLISTILVTSGFASDATSEKIAKLDDGVMVFGDITMNSQTVEIGKPENGTKSYVYTYGRIQAKGHPEITTEENKPATLFNGYCFKQENPDTNPHELYAHGGIDSKIEPADGTNIKIWQLSVLRSLTHQLDKGQGLPTDSDDSVTIDLAKNVDPKNPVFLISPTIEDQMGMARLMDTESKIVSKDPSLRLNIIMQGEKSTDGSNWEQFTEKAMDTKFKKPFRDLKLSLLEEVQGSATLMGECDLTVDEDEMTIPTVLKSTKIDEKMTNIGEMDGKDTKITINSEGKKITFEEDVDFSSHGATLAGNGGVFVFKKGLKL